MICPNCQSENADGAKFCNHCGAALFDRPDKLIADSIEAIQGMDRKIPADISDPQFMRAFNDDVEKTAPSQSEAAPQTSDLLTNPNLGASAPIPFKGESLAPVVEAMFTRKSDDPTVPATPTWDTSPIDFTGFEQLVDSSYVPPKPQTKVGDTLELPPLDADDKRPGKDYRASMSHREDRRQKREEKRQARELKHAQKREERERAHAMKKFGAADRQESEAALASVAAAEAAATDPKTERVSEPVGEDSVTAQMGDGSADASAPEIKPVANGASSPASGGSSEKHAAIAMAAPDAGNGATKVKSRHSRVWIPIVIAVLVAAAAVVGLTYYFQLWGGKVVPDVVGMTEDEGETVLTDAGFAVRVVEVKSESPTGTVLLTDPNGGARAPEGGEVVMHVAIPRTVPDIVGMSRDEAASTLAEDGFVNVEFLMRKSDETEGSVLSVEPAAGSQARAGTPIKVTVAEPFIVPEVEGLSVAEAESAITDAGLVVSTVPYYTEEIAEGTAVSTDPAAGTKVPGGSKVTLSVARSRKTELIEATKAFLTVGSSITVSGGDYPSGTYVINSLDAVSYNGSDGTSFTITATPYGITNFWFLISPEVSYGTPIQISGVATWTDGGHLSTVWPNIARVS